MVNIFDFVNISLWDVILWGALLVSSLFAVFTTYQAIIFGKVNVRNMIIIWIIPVLILLFILGKSLFDYVKNNLEMALVIGFLIILGALLLTPKSKKRK